MLLILHQYGNLTQKDGEYSIWRPGEPRSGTRQRTTLGLDNTLLNLNCQPSPTLHRQTGHRSANLE